MYQIIALATIVVLYYALSSWFTRRRQTRLAAQWGCQPAYRRHSKLPLGFDFLWQLLQADRTDNLPNHIEDIVAEVDNKHTWIQTTAGSTFINTNEPRNVRLPSSFQWFAALADDNRSRQFLPPSLGNLRLGQFDREASSL
jgi:hypothetical protein